ncbi:MAG: protein kinase [Sedimentisphaerales bacterium]|nr:protein kinase [Sedimentisphaerales bacterium]
MSACPTKELVERYLTGGCSQNERQVFEKHLTQCDDCRATVEVTRSTMGQSSRHDSETLADEKTLAIAEDERPTETLSQATVVSPGRPDFAKSLESMIEGYQIVETLPQGGQAVVYKAVHTATKTNVAIKVLLPSLLASDRARYYFEREAELIASLDHPNIVSIRDSGIIHRQYYFVMQYIDGEPLRAYVQARRLSFRERVDLFKKICSAVSYAHQQGIIHRDLKFANILVDKHGEPHILDFGLAKAVGLDEQADDKAVVTMTGQWAGSLSTMSPEQASGMPNLIDVRTDVYSLGVILYTLLTGQYPYDVNGPTLEALKNIQQAQPVRPRQIVPKFNSEMEAILLTALEKERQKRYQSTAELQSDIENWLEGRPIRVKSISTMYLLRKIIARHRYTSTVVALLAIIVIAFAWISFELFKQSERALDESKLIARDYAIQAQKYGKTTLGAKPLYFALFLKEWREGRIDNAKKMARYFQIGSTEDKAAIVLLADASSSEKEDRIHKSFSGERAWFADFIIGERRLMDGSRDEALEAFHSSYDRIRQLPQESRTSFDDLMIDFVKARLYDLERAVNPSNQPSAVQPEGENQ